MSLQPPQYLSAAELAWLRNEEPPEPAVATVAFTFERPLDSACLKARIEDRLMSYPRFRQRLEAPHLPLSRPRWREHDRFALSDHLFRHRLDGDDRPDALEEFIGGAMSRPLDASRPLWEIHVLEGLAAGAALVARVHQSVADPTAVPRLLLRLTDGDSAGPASPVGPTPSAVADLGLRSLLPPPEAIAGGGDSVAQTRMLCRLIAARSDRRAPFRGRNQGARGVAWSAAVALDALQDGAARSRIAVHEILLAAVAGALRSELHCRDTPAADVELSASLLLDLRRQSDELLGTRMALARLRLPLQSSSASARLQRTRQELSRLAAAPERLTVLGVRPGRGFSMSEVEERSLRLLGRKASVTLAMLEAPRTAAALCGEPLTGILFWPALIGGPALGISAIAFAGGVRFAVVVGDSGSRAAQRLAAGLSEALEKTAREAASATTP